MSDADAPPASERRVSAPVTSVTRAAVSTSLPWVAATAAVVAFVAVAGTVGADARWLAALGRAIVEGGAIPDGVPYAAAPSEGWPNVLVAAELAFWALDAALGERGLLLAQLTALAAALTLLAVTARRGGAPAAGVAVVVLLVAVAAFSHLVVVRVQLFSLALFPLVLALLHSEARAPSRRIWLLVPLVALWGNLHGAVLAGLAVAGAYLLLERARLDALTALGVLAASSAALLLTPALHRTPEYYLGVLRNEAARRSFGLWEPLDFTSPFDLVFLAAAAVLLVLAVRARPALWETVAIAGLAVMTARAERSGVWLVFVLAVPAARRLRAAGALRPLVGRAALGAAAAAAVFGLVRGPLATGVGEPLLEQTLRGADGTAVLAEPLLAEQVALAGGRVWIANPLDAFALGDQRTYLDWLEGLPAGDRALRLTPRAVLVADGSPADERLARDAGFVEEGRDDGAALYVRRRPGARS